MQIPSLTTLRVEDYPTERSWIGKLLFPLNQFLLQATTSINGNITFGDNIPGITATIDFTYGGLTDYPKSFVWTLPSKPVEVRLCSAMEDGIPVALAFEWQFLNVSSATNGNVVISNFYKISGSGISALRSGARYIIVLRGQY